VIQGSEPEEVRDIELRFNSGAGVHAQAHMYGVTHRLSEDQLVDAVGLYLSGYYSFAVERLDINLRYVDANVYSADVIVQRG
jgi:hypothetical protein